MTITTLSKIQLATAVGILLFWILFFTIGFENPKYPSYYTKFEHSFPLPDTFLCIVLFLAFKNRSTTNWKIYTLIASGAMVFLGLCDFSFNILNGMYQVGIIDSMMNAFINIWCVSFGLFQIFYVQKTGD